jgi:hypothetical protein
MTTAATNALALARFISDIALPSAEAGCGALATMIAPFCTAVE